MKEPVTLKDIAAQLGVSIATVDRAVNNRGRVSPETREKILRKIEECGYKANKIARSLVKNRIFHIGVVLFLEPKFFWSEIERGIRHIEEEYKDFGIVVSYFRIGEDAKEQEYAIDKLTSGNIDALIITPYSSKSIIDKLNKCVEKETIVVTINSDIKEINRLFFVGPQDKGAGKTAGQLMGNFIKRRGKVAVVSYPYEYYSYNERSEGFIQQLRATSPEIEIIDKTKEIVNEIGKYNPYFITKYYLQNISDLVGIYNNDGCIYEVGLAVKDENPKNKVIVIGHEISPEIAELVDQEYIDVIISQDPFSQGYFAMKLLCNFFIENVKPKFNEYFTSIDIIIKSNKEPHQENIIGISRILP